MLPPAVTGAVVMLIGFNLAPVATKTYMPSDPWVAILTMLAVIVMAVGLRGFFGRIAVFLGLIFGYVLSLVFDGIFGKTSLPLPGNPEPGAHDRVNWDCGQRPPTGSASPSTPSTDWWATRPSRRATPTSAGTSRRSPWSSSCWSCPP